MIRSYPKARTEFRIVCSDKSHAMHAWEKRSYAAAVDAIERIEGEQAEAGMPYVMTCAPWKIESREVGAWEKV